MLYPPAASEALLEDLRDDRVSVSKVQLAGWVCPRAAPCRRTTALLCPSCSGQLGASPCCALPTLSFAAIATGPAVCPPVLAARDAYVATGGHVPGQVFLRERVLPLGLVHKFASFPWSAHQMVGTAHRVMEPPCETTLLPRMCVCVCRTGFVGYD